MKPFIDENAARFRGRSLGPIMTNTVLPFGGRIFESNLRVLDTAMGYGCELAHAKFLFRDLSCVGIDKNMILSKRVFERGPQFTYGKARAVVKSAFDEDILADCNVLPGNALALPFQSNTFDRVLSVHLVHHLPRNDRVKTYQEAFRTLAEDGVLTVLCASGKGLEELTTIKGKYEFGKVTDQHATHPDIDHATRSAFLEDIRSIFPRYDILTADDKQRIESIAGSPDKFHLSGLLPDFVYDDLENAGFGSVDVTEFITEGSPIRNYIVAFAKK